MFGCAAVALVIYVVILLFCDYFWLVSEASTASSPSAPHDEASHSRVLPTCQGKSGEVFHPGVSKLNLTAPQAGVFLPPLQVAFHRAQQKQHENVTYYRVHKSSEYSN